MNAETEFQLAPLFQAVGQALRQERQALNQADPYDGDHGDNMVQVFQLAARAAEEQRAAALPDAMESAARQLEAQPDNGSAQVYARGLRHIAAQLRKYDVTLEDLVAYVGGALAKDKEKEEKMGAGAEAPAQKASASGDVLKALVAGLAAWGQAERGESPSDKALDMGTLFEFGLAYMQAKQRGGDRVEVLANAAASVSPLQAVPHRYQSGVIAIQALLRAMQEDWSGLP